MNEIVVIENLDKIFEKGGNKVHALSGVNLKIKQGEFVVVMGPSGSGKTTLLNILGCLDRSTGGNVILDGRDVSKLNEHQLSRIRRDKIGFIFQAGNLMPILNAIENVELPMECKKISKDESLKRAQYLLKLVGLEERMKQKPNQLSAGEQQRVAIARAFANQPSIILADEPTGNLDSKTGSHIMELLKRLNQNLGTTIIVVTHDEQMALHAERKMVLEDGEITDMYVKRAKT
ncbi:MAG: ABC transporter ATP-binding protein, partial [Candidatus Heimdallarchaeaceae archaeon]